MTKFIDYVLDLLSPFGNIKSRAMFGGYAIYKDGLIIAIIFDNELYFKTDLNSSVEYRDKGSKPFTYNAKNGKIVQMPYWQLPLDVLEDEELLGAWIGRAYDVSLKAKNA